MRSDMLCLLLFIYSPTSLCLYPDMPVQSVIEVAKWPTEVHFRSVLQINKIPGCNGPGLGGYLGDLSDWCCYTRCCEYWLTRGIPLPEKGKNVAESCFCCDEDTVSNSSELSRQVRAMIPPVQPDVVWGRAQYGLVQPFGWAGPSPRLAVWYWTDFVWTSPHALAIATLSFS
jgi:hypothetical protein